MVMIFGFIVFAFKKSMASECYGYNLEDHYYSEEANACVVDDLAYYCTNCPVFEDFKECGDFKVCELYRCKNKENVFYQVFDNSNSEMFFVFNFNQQGNLIAYRQHLSYGSYCCSDDNREVFYKQYGDYHECERIPLDSGDSSQTPAPPPDACGCASALPPWMALLPLPLLLRRRLLPER